MPDLLTRRARAVALLDAYDLQLSPLDRLDDEQLRRLADPQAAVETHRLEATWLAELEADWSARGPGDDVSSPDGLLAAMRALAARDRIPPAYRWLAHEATWPELLDFLALEGGPDAGFDDLVALCQVGLRGAAKLELARNYWDEMGGGTPDRVHTSLYERLTEALSLPTVRREDQPVQALERVALTGMLATNRWLQPELLGALGAIELQAGPRCRMVLKAFDRLGAPADAYPFYAEHAEVDPRHGKDWVDHALLPAVEARPDWGARIVKGAWWRGRVSESFFEMFVGDRRAA